MSELLSNLLVSPGNDYLYENDFITFIESHLPYLKANGMASVSVDPAAVYKNERNFFALLLDLGYPMEDFYTLLRLNGFTNPMELTMEFDTLNIPNRELLGQLKQLYRTQNKRV